MKKGDPKKHASNSVHCSENYSLLLEKDSYFYKYLVVYILCVVSKH